MKLTRNPNLTVSTHEPGSGDALRLPWTGKAPEQTPGFEDGVLTSLPQPNLATCTRAEVQAYFDNTWTLTEVLFESLSCAEALFSAPYHHLRHPLVFYYAHPPVLYVNKLRVAGVLDNELQAYYETLFETGVDEMSWDDMSKNAMTWPKIDAIVDYRRRVYAAVSKVIAEHPGLADGHPPVGWGDPLWALFMGFEHERIHLETSSVLIRELPVEWLRRPSSWPADAPEAEERRGGVPSADVHYPVNDWVDVAAQTVALGKARDAYSFGWDNEYGACEREVRSFSASRTLISNGEFHAFVAEGGYTDETFWTSEGWRWRTFRNVRWPTFWISDGPSGLHHYKLRTIFDVVDMPWSWPVIVNAHEARAFANWRGRDDEERTYRLPTEAEDLALRGLGDSADAVLSQSGADFRRAGVNLNLAFGSEGPVDGLPANAVGVHDAQGSVWRWVEDDFHPLPGAEVHPYYDDFSTPCYDGEHSMILGGSFVSTGDLASRFARYHFRPHFFQHAGFRLVRADHDGEPVLLKDHAPDGKYEQAAVLAQYLELHYGTPEEAMPWAIAREGAEFSKRCVQLVERAAQEHGVAIKRAFDLGCAVGRASFELARTAEEVVGVDLSAAFIETCEQLQRDGALNYEARLEGELREARVARVDPALDRSRVTFRRADAQALPPEFEGFDAVLAANLIDRLPSPGACLRRMGGPRGLVREGGLLVVCSPYTWYTEFTPREVWLGGVVRDGRELTSAEGLRELLEDEGFAFLSEHDLPLVIREHRRKFELVISHATVWQRRR